MPRVLWKDIVHTPLEAGEPTNDDEQDLMIYRPDGIRIADCTENGFMSYAEKKFYADMLIKRVNAHDKLVEALTNSMNLLNLFGRETDDVWRTVMEESQKALDGAK